MLRGKKILLGISGGIAAYKTASLVRLFVKAGAEVKVIMTPAAINFVSPLTLSVLSKNDVVTHFFDNKSDNPSWNNHVELGLWADLFIIAPATASTISKMTSGNCDNILIAAYLSAKCPVFFAPSMDLDMYQHPSTKNNLEKLTSYGNIIIPAEIGELASGLFGEGRMAEPENIIQFLDTYEKKKDTLKGKKVLITAGPTYELLDPVRFVGNFSTGNMGIQLAEVAQSLGAEVNLILGPTSLKPSSSKIKVHNVVSASEMFDVCKSLFNDCSIFIGAAAVADYRPKLIANQKIKKHTDDFSIEMVKNPDILKTFGTQKSNQIVVGFALETQNEILNASEKVKNKNLDFIVLNSLNDTEAGFAKPTNKVTFIDKFGVVETFSTKLKSEVALDIFNKIIRIQNV